MAKIKIIIGWICIVLCGLIALSTLVIRFMFPELTETQLFLKMWWIIPTLILCVVGYKWGFSD